MVTSSARVLSLLTLVGCGSPALGAPVRVHTLEGEQVHLDRVTQEHEATVLIWWASTCPCVARYHQRVLDLRAALPPEVAMFAVASNADDDHERLLRARAEGHLPLPVLHDHDGKLADRLGVIATPTAVVLDREGRARYVGWIDNERLPGDPERVPYLQQAIHAVLSGTQPSMARSRVFGCRVTQSLVAAAPCGGGG